MKKIIYALMLLTFFTGCTLNSQKENALNNNQPIKFAVYLADTNQLIFSDEDLESYDASTHTFTFTKEGVEKMKSYQPVPQINAGLYQKSFVAKLGNEEMYRGKFWTNVSSLSELGIVISDVVMISPEYRTLRVATSYPFSNLAPDNENQKKIDDERIIKHFRAINKLK